MAERPVFIPKLKNKIIQEKTIEFKWNPGFSIKQKQRNISDLHTYGNEKGINPILEISTKSENTLGVKLSAFNLMMKLDDGSRVSVESAFQSSKVFQNGGPYTDLLKMTGKEIKKDERIKNSGKLIKFVFENSDWNLEPKSSFYDWLYLNALKQNKLIAKELVNFEGFTDIEFNPKKQINCQARSAALFVYLTSMELLDEIISNKKTYLNYFSNFDHWNSNSREIEQTDIFSTLKNQKEEKIKNKLSKITNEFISKHWNTNRLKGHNPPKWILIDNYKNSVHRDLFGCFALIRNDKINLIGQSYTKENTKEEKLLNFGEIIDNYLLKEKVSQHSWQNFDSLYIYPIDKELIYLSKSIKEFLKGMITS